MNIRFALPLALLLGAAFLPACGDQAAKAKDAVENVADLGPKATEAIGKLTSGLNGITDLKGAQEAAKNLLPNLDILAKAKAALGDKMPDLSSLGTVVTSLKEKFSGKMDILGALEPIFKQIMALLGK